MKVSAPTRTFRCRPRLAWTRGLWPALSLASFLLASLCPAWGQHRIAGVVFERQAEQKVPLKGARVEAWSPDGSRVLAQAWSDSLGRYAISHLVPERVTLTVTRSGYYPLYGNGRRDGIVVVCLASGDCAQVDFEMVQEGVLEIRVTDQIGHPIEDVLYTVTPLDEAGTARPPSQRKRTLLRRCSKQGQCVVPGMSPGRYLIRGESPRRGAVTIQDGSVEIEFQPRQESLAVHLVLPAIPTYRVSGRILGLAAADAGRSMVILETAFRAERHPTAFRPTGAMLDPDGTFGFIRIPAGEYWLKLVSPDTSDIISSRRGVRLGRVSVKEDVAGLVFHAPPIDTH